MKKIIAVLMAVTILSGFMAGCTVGEIEHQLPQPVIVADTPEPSEPPSTPEPEPVRLSVVATAAPQYDLLKVIGGDMIDLRLEDPASVTSANLIVYAGEGIEEWGEDTLPGGAEFFNVLELVRLLPACPPVIYDDYTGESDTGDGADTEDAEDTGVSDDAEDVNEEDSDDVEGNTEEDEEEPESEPEPDVQMPAYDYGIWSSIRNIITVTEALAAELARLSPGYAQRFWDNAEKLIAELDELDAGFARFFRENDTYPLIFSGGGFPLKYFAHDYGLVWHAGGHGTLVPLIKESRIPVIFVSEQSDRVLARRTADTAGIDLIVMLVPADGLAVSSGGSALHSAMYSNYIMFQEHLIVAEIEELPEDDEEDEGEGEDDDEEFQG